MAENNDIKLFGNQKIRTAWDADKEEWYFSVLDAVTILTDSSDPKQYIKKMRSRDPELGSKWGTICTPVAMTAADGKVRKIQAADVKGLLRIIQSIPSPKAEPFKMWLAQVGKDRIDEDFDPEKAMHRAVEVWQRAGYSPEWIRQRLLTIQVRNELTDEWKAHGVKKGYEYAILTDEVYKAWSGMTAKQYKELKGLQQESLRDNMSTPELILNALAEMSTTEISKAENPTTLAGNKSVAKRGGAIAGEARKSIEAQTGKPVVTSKTATNFSLLIEDVSNSVDAADDKKNKQ